MGNPSALRNAKWQDTRAVVFFVDVTTWGEAYDFFIISAHSYLVVFYLSFSALGSLFGYVGRVTGDGESEGAVSVLYKSAVKTGLFNFR